MSPPQIAQRYTIVARRGSAQARIYRLVTENGVVLPGWFYADELIPASKVDSSGSTQQGSSGNTHGNNGGGSGQGGQGGQGAAQTA